MTDPTVTVPSRSEGEEALVVPRPWIYWFTFGVLIVLWFIAGYLFWKFPFIGSINLGYVIWTLGLLHFITGLEIITPEKMAGILVFGYPTIIVIGGPVIAPAGIIRLAIFKRSTVEMEIPEEPEKIYHGDGECPAGMRPPIRITFANGTPEEIARDPLHQRVTTEVTPFVRFRIKDLWCFYVRMGATELDAFAEARRQLEDMCVSVLQEDLTKQTLSHAIANVERINDRLDNEVSEHTSNWGVEIIDVRIKLYGLSHSLNRSIQSIAESIAQKQSKIITAEGDKQSQILTAEASEETFRKEGRGRADATKADLDARTQGMKDMAEALRLDTIAILGAETARAMAQSPSDKIIIGTDGFKDLVGVGKVIADGMRNGPSTPPSTT